MTFHLEKKQLLKGLGLALACFLLLVIGVGVLLDVSLKLQTWRSTSVILFWQDRSI